MQEIEETLLKIECNLYTPSSALNAIQGEAPREINGSK